MSTVAYCRVSTDGQSLNAQIEALTKAGAEKIFAEKISGAKDERPELNRALAYLQKGDVLLVTRLDRLARSTLNLLGILKLIDGRGASFKSLADTWADTTTPHGRLMLTVLGGIAEFERELIKARTSEGRTRAKARGVRFGRDFKLTAGQRAIIRLAWRGGGYTISHLARQYAVSRKTILRAINEPVEVVVNGLPGRPETLGHGNVEAT
jgi:DNA invertase Pin-like site-specific DNA recombinase